MLRIFENESPDLKISQWLLLSLGIHLICAYFSVGYWQPDEHYQILEFLGTKLYGTPTSSLPWEFNAQIRPWFQIFSYYSILKLIPLRDPFIVATFLRLITSLFSFISLIFLTKTVFAYFNESQKKHWLILSSLFWFMPLLHARTSAENVSASFFFIGLYFFLQTNRNFLSGFLLGLSFISKFQMGLMIAPLFLWGLYNKYSLKKLSLTLFAILMATSLGVLIDYWGYQTWVFVPWNYFKINLLQGKAAEFGVYPWYFYFEEILKKGIGPLGLILLLATLKGWKDQISNPITWASIFYFLIHLLIGHKELRFLTPLFPLSIFYLTLWIPTNFFQKGWVKALAAVNILILVYVCTTPLRTVLVFKKLLYNQASEIKTLYTSTPTPYRKHKVNDNFFKPKDFKVIDLASLDNLQKNSESFWWGTDALSEIKTLLNQKNCSLRYLQYPKFLIEHESRFLARNVRPWSLFFCNHKPGT